jgi:hypothetical protein
MCNDSVRSPLPLVEPERNEKCEAHGKIGVDVRVAPFVRAPSPIEGEEQEGCSDNEKKAANWVTCPGPLLKGHSRIVGPLLWPVEGKEAQRSESVERYLDPENVPPSRGANVGDCTSCEASDAESVSYEVDDRGTSCEYLQTTHCARSSRESIGQRSIFEGQDFRRNGLDNGNCCQRRTNKDTAANEHAHRGGFCANDAAYASNEWWNSGKHFAVQHIRQSAYKG